MPTIGVSLAIPEPWADELQTYRTGLGDTSALLIPTHITLVPPIDLDDIELAAVEQHLSEVARDFEPFRVHLRGTGTFRPVSPVVFIALAEGISKTEQLAQACRQGPLALDLGFPFHPHVTVAHHLDDQTLERAFEELAHFDCAFEVRDFHLYVHDAQTGWQPTNDYALAGG